MPKLIDTSLSVLVFIDKAGVQWPVAHSSQYILKSIWIVFLFY